MSIERNTFENSHLHVNFVDALNNNLFATKYLELVSDRVCASTEALPR